MNHKVEISIIIPAFNEEKTISECLKRTFNYCLDKHSDFEIIIAEDGSDDNTVKIIEDFTQKDERIKLISIKERLGKGGAIANAMLTAKKKYVAFMDADLSADPFEFQRLFEEITNFDVVIGSRLLRGNLSSVKRPAYRTLFSHLYSMLFRFLFKIPIHDPQCGFSRRMVDLLRNTTSNAFGHFDILTDESVRQGLKSYSNWPTYPQLYVTEIFQIKLAL